MNGDERKRGFCRICTEWRERSTMKMGICASCRRKMSGPSSDIGIADAAIDFIQARRRKIDWKAERNRRTSKCIAQGKGQVESCWTERVGPDGEFRPDEDLCPDCLLARKLHVEMVEQSRKAGMLLRKLERRVNMRTEGR